jgi:hypothetical protein
MCAVYQLWKLVQYMGHPDPDLGSTTYACELPSTIWKQFNMVRHRLEAKR